MKLIVFAGPTISEADVRAEIPDAIVLPPAAQGDVHRATLARPRAIGLIDGYFERVPAVWHKELLWAMSQGVHVYGAASMGALRAAELAPFGMIGIGVIAEAFTRGDLEDDDEVAVAHGPAEDGYRASSEAMVNLRATFAAALHQGLLDEPEERALVRIAKSLFYPDRTFPAILRVFRSEGAPASLVDRLAAWLPEGRVNQKRLDAIAMLRALRDDLAASASPKTVGYTFEHTDVWEHLVQTSHRPFDLASPTALDASPSSPEGLLEELGVRGDLPALRVAAIARALALEEGRRHAFSPSPELVQATADTFRRERGLHGADAITAWLRDEGLDEATLTRLLRDETIVRWAFETLRPDMLRALPDLLRLAGGHAALLARIATKRRLLADRGLSNPSVADAPLTDEALWAWYFDDHLAASAPHPTSPIPRDPKPISRPADLHAFAQTAGFENVDDLRRAVLREWWFLRLTSASTNASVP